MGVLLGFVALHAEASICLPFHARPGISVRVAKLSAPCCSRKNYGSRSYNPCRIGTSRFLFPKSFGAFSSENAACFPFFHKPLTRASERASSNFSIAKTSSPAWSPRFKHSGPLPLISTRIAMAWSRRGLSRLRDSFTHARGLPPR
jgi:hypothetical protein